MKPPALLGSFARISAVLILAALCFQAGRWTGQLESKSAVVPDVGNALVSPSHPVVAAAEKAVEPQAPAGTGAPVGQPTEVITPLNVRDPSALVMGPVESQCPAPLAEPRAVPMPIPRAHKLRKEPLPEGKLLDLMKKHEDKPNEPKVY